MTKMDVAALQQELKEFREEKEKIRAIVGAIGGKASARRDKLVNVIFIGLIAALLLLEAMRHFLHIATDALPPLFSIELGVLLVSVKIIWMINRQAKVEHFQFWILNSLEFRLTDIAKRIRNMESRLGGKETTSTGQSSAK